jgi:SnoaL-like domain
LASLLVCGRYRIKRQSLRDDPNGDKPEAWTEAVGRPGRGLNSSHVTSVTRASDIPTGHAGLAVSSEIDPDVGTRARVQEHWEASERGDAGAEHAIYAVDAILDYPQSGERFRGRAKIQAQRGGHPAERHFTIRRILGGGDLWVSECVITYDGVPTYSLSVMQLTDGLVTHETQYFADPFPAPPGRAALAEPIPARDQ